MSSAGMVIWVCKEHNETLGYAFAIMEGDEVVALVKSREDARFIFENKRQVHRLTEEVRRVSVQCQRLQQKNKTLERILRRMVDLLRGSSPADLAAARVEAERIQRTI